MSALNYDEIYKICEELQQLQGAQLQGVLFKPPTRYYLDFRLPGFNRWLLIDLAPADPLFLTLSEEQGLEKIKKGAKQTPVSNFLRAHFLNHRIHSLEVAQKPNRTVRVSFDIENTILLTFKCFPHGYEIKLQANDKRVVVPRRTTQLEDEVTFIEPQRINSWQFNDQCAQDHLKVITSKPLESYHLKLIKKLERALQAIDEGEIKGREKDLQKINELEVEAQALKAEMGDAIGQRLDEIYAELKRVKRKGEQTLVRKNDLAGQLEKLRSQSGGDGVLDQVQTPQKQRTKIFSGTRIRLDPQWELWVGRNAWQNEDLLKISSPHDLWIHLRDYPGAHGTLRGPKKTEPPVKHIEYACRVVALLSQSKKKPFSEGEPLDFIVTPRKFVKKPKGAAPGLVIVERENVRRIAFKNFKFEVI
ncbi:MAG: hypothetical protein SGI74_01095 [Oligoflexia bacterium]|nr:hypothetical protein [Oligoflexia bacterium]